MIKISNQMNNYLVKDVFTPTKPARITFIDRELINDRLVNALQMPGKQIIVYGHSGSGKTTLLLNKLNQLYEASYYVPLHEGYDI